MSLPTDITREIERATAAKTAAFRAHALAERAAMSALDVGPVAYQEAVKDIQPAADALYLATWELGMAEYRAARYRIAAGGATRRDHTTRHPGPRPGSRGP